MMRPPRHRLHALLLAAAVATTGARAAEPAPAEEPDLRKLKVKELPQKYRDWLEEEVYYIIADREKDVFLRLKTDELREMFIQQFWDRRDPVPSTAVNEYREEIGKRLSYVREYYKILRQDRARIYMTMGPPTKVNGYHNSSDWWPMEVWEYENTGIPEIPNRITLLFYKPRNSGLFRLWSPTVDGFNSLRTTAPAGASMAREIQPGRYVPNIIAEAMRGVAPGVGPFGSERILMDVQKPPAVNLAGVERILTGSVTTAISYGALPIKATAKWYFGDEAGRRDVSVALEVPANEVKYTSYRGKSFFGLFVAGQVRRGKDTRSPIVAEWSGTVDSTLTPEERERTKEMPFLYTYRFKLLPGSYHLNLVARDDASQRLGILDIPLDVPEAAPGGPQLSDAIFALKLSRLEDASGNVYAPFVFDRVEMLPSVEQVLGTRLPATVFLQVRHPRAADPRPMHLRYALHPVAGGGRAAWEDADDLLADKANAAGVQSVLKQMDLRAVPEGGYELRVDLRDGPVEGAAPGAVLATARTKVRVTAAAVSPARIVARSFETEDPAKAAHSAGLQLLAQGKFQAAREEFRVALGHDPDMAAAKINLARAMVLSGDALAAKEAILEITAAAPTPEALMVLGSAHAGLAEHADAVRAYERALELGGESPDVLNALAEALAQAGEKVRAREIAQRSLALKADQPLLQRFLDSLGP